MTDTEAIRELLMAAFDDESLGYFCYDYFRPVYERFSTGMSKSDRTQRLIEYCERNNKVDELLARVRQANPPKYAEYEPRLQPSPTPPLPHSPPNPFGERGRIEDPARFSGREGVLRTVFEELGKGTSLSVVGPRQIGKSSLLCVVKALGPERLHRPAADFAYLDMQLIHDEEGFFEAIWYEFGLAACRGMALYRLLRAQGRRVVLCLDEVEKMTWRGFTLALRSELRGLADGANAPLALVIASELPLSRLFADSPTADQPHLTSPLANLCLQVDLLPFSPQEAQEFIAARLRGTGVTFGAEEIAAAIGESGGHPARLQEILRGLYARHTGG
jgi:hypothetical protein